MFEISLTVPNSVEFRELGLEFELDVDLSPVGSCDLLCIVFDRADRFHWFPRRRLEIRSGGLLTERDQDYLFLELICVRIGGSIVPKLWKSSVVYVANYLKINNIEECGDRTGWSFKV